MPWKPSQPAMKSHLFVHVEKFLDHLLVGCIDGDLILVHLVGQLTEPLRVFLGRIEHDLGLPL